MRKTFQFGMITKNFMISSKKTRVFVQNRLEITIFFRYDEKRMYYPVLLKRKQVNFLWQTLFPGC